MTTDYGIQRRRSTRIRALQTGGGSSVKEESRKPSVTKKHGMDQEKVSMNNEIKAKKKKVDLTDIEKPTGTTLPRTRESEVLKENPSIAFVMGIDEAGRGPLAGPVVAAAVLSTCTTVQGICDSKKLTKEAVREELYHRLTTSPNLRYAVAVVDAQTIDEINILQATFEAMRLAACGVLGLASNDVRYEDKLSIKHKGCYVVRGGTDESGENGITKILPLDQAKVYSLIDGNRMPPKLPTIGETMTKGDGREYLIGAASILAKVSRDALMNEYHELYPHFLFQQNKGYPTAKHMALVHEHGPLPIHRLTFAPLKQMDLDNKNDGKSDREVSDDVVQDSKPKKKMKKKGAR